MVLKIRAGRIRKTVELTVNTAREEEYAILLLPLTPVIPQAY